METVTEFKNPAPVVVGLVFENSRSILTVKWKIPPFVGEFALPGGFVNLGENWRAALKRELLEEASVGVSTDEKHMKVFDVRSTPDGSKILIFAVVNPEGVTVCDFVQNDEVSERQFATLDYYSSPQLCFPLHTQVLERYRNENHTHESQHPGGW